MNVLLIYPPKINQYNYNQEASKTGLTLGLAYIAAFLNQNHHHTDIINAPYQGLDSEYIIRQISIVQYKLVGISMSIQEDVPDGIELARKIRKAYPNIIIIVGGHFATHESKEILRNVNEIDIVIRGEGEKTILNLIQAFESGDSLCNVNGITFRENGELLSNAPASLIDDLDSLPSPINELYRLSGLEEESVTISAQRGCYGNCSFCSIVAFYGKSIIRRRSPHNVVDEIEEYYNRFGKRVFSFIDDDFVDHSKSSINWIDEFCNEIKKRDLKIKFNMVFRANDCTLEILQPLIDVGLYEVGIGVESFSENVLKRMNKNISLQDITNAVKIVREAGLKLIIGYIMFEPDMSFDDLYKNYIFLRMYGFFAPVHVYNYAKPYSGTPLRNKLMDEKRLILSNWYDVGKYNFADERVQKIFNQLMELKQTLVQIEKLHRENKLCYNKFIFGFLHLDYSIRVKTRDSIYEIINLDKKIEQLETSISINSLGTILKSMKKGIETVSIQSDVEHVLSEIKELLYEIEKLCEKLKNYFGE